MGVTAKSTNSRNSYKLMNAFSDLRNDMLATIVSRYGVYALFDSSICKVFPKCEHILINIHMYEVTKCYTHHLGRPWNTQCINMHFYCCTKTRVGTISKVILSPKTPTSRWKIGKITQSVTLYLYVYIYYIINVVMNSTRKGSICYLRLHKKNYGTTVSI